MAPSKEQVEAHMVELELGKLMSLRNASMEAPLGEPVEAQMGAPLD